MDSSLVLSNLVYIHLHAYASICIHLPLFACFAIYLNSSALPALIYIHLHLYKFLCINLHLSLFIEIYIILHFSAFIWNSTAFVCMHMDSSLSAFICIHHLFICKYKYLFAFICINLYSSSFIKNCIHLSALICIKVWKFSLVMGEGYCRSNSFFYVILPQKYSFFLWKLS